MNIQERNPMYTTPAHVSRISIARLYNLGDYEHARYEITVEVPEGVDAAVAFTTLDDIVEALNPKCPVNEYNLSAARTWLAKTDADKQKIAKDEFGEEEVTAGMVTWLKRRDDDATLAIHANDEHILRRDMAIAALKDMGGIIK